MQTSSLSFDSMAHEGLELPMFHVCGWGGWCFMYRQKRSQHFVPLSDLRHLFHCNIAFNERTALCIYNNQISEYMDKFDRKTSDVAFVISDLSNPTQYNKKWAMLPRTQMGLFSFLGRQTKSI